MRLALSPLLLALLLALTGCGGGGDAGGGTQAEDPGGTSQEPAEALSACEEAFQEAAGVGAGEDAHADLWPAFDACESVDEFAAASSEFPTALDGADPATYAQNQCAYEPEVKDTALCKTLP